MKNNNNNDNTNNDSMTTIGTMKSSSSSPPPPPELLMKSSPTNPGAKYLSSEDLPKEDQEIIKTNGIFRGFFVESGLNTYTMEFVPEDMLYGYYLTIITLFIIISCISIIYFKGYGLEEK